MVVVVVAPPAELVASFVTELLVAPPTPALPVGAQVCPTGHMQEPLRHCSPSAQSIPQPPQFELSVSVSTHEPPHGACPAWHPLPPLVVVEPIVVLGVPALVVPAAVPVATMPLTLLSPEVVAAVATPPLVFVAGSSESAWLEQAPPNTSDRTALADKCDVLCSRIMARGRSRRALRWVIAQTQALPILRVLMPTRGTIRSTFVLAAR
jgi:hypothetical protein